MERTVLLRKDFTMSLKNRGHIISWRTAWGKHQNWSGDRKDRRDSLSKKHTGASKMALNCIVLIWCILGHRGCDQLSVEISPVTEKDCKKEYVKQNFDLVFPSLNRGDDLTYEPSLVNWPIKAIPSDKPLALSKNWPA